ncbi:MAG: EamA family transporter [Christensenellales bacterium]
MQNKQTLSKPLVVMLLASLCCLLWGSAIPFINLGYRYFGVTSSDTATQILFGGCRFFLAGLLTILFESVAQKKPALPKKTSWGNVVKLSLAQTIIQYVFFYIGVAHTASAKGAIIQGLQAFTSILIACLSSGRRNERAQVEAAIMAWRAWSSSTGRRTAWRRRE